MASAADLEEEKKSHPPVDETVGIDDAKWLGQIEILRRSARRAGPVMKISLRPLKQVTESLPNDHPLKILLAGEHDDIPLEEYLSKLPGWFRLLRSRE